MTDQKTIDVFFSINSFMEEELRNKTVVVIDVLRASSTIVTALLNGASAVIPVADMGEASKIAQNVDSDYYLLCGEKDGIKIEGYDLGNSPLEYTPEVVKGKKLIFNTTNGTKAIKKTFNSSQICIGSFLNVSAVAEMLKKQPNEIVLVCAGWKGRLAFEDMLCAGNILYNLLGEELNETARDGVRIAHSLYKTYGSRLSEVIHQSNHAERLKEQAGPEDIDYCSQTDITDIVPCLHEGMITLANG
ncbi:MAG: 2-phosphosulfolactate phosphatase [Balneolaceae bacterium]|nr:MAG: 2-phosphosulfolactate phosphatase [Balneolaceae bacterium]